MATRQLNELDEEKNLLERAGRVIDSITIGLNEVEFGVRRKIMERCGEACAVAGSLNIAEKITEEALAVKDIIRLVNKEIPWCGSWSLKGKIIEATCTQCGCPLVRNKIVNLNETFCYCSLGWVKKIFSTLLKRPINAELKASIGRGDKICNFVVYT